MSITRRNRLLIGAVIIGALVCSFFNGYRQIRSQVKEIETVFMADSSDTLSVHYDLVKIDDCLSNTISLSNNINLSSSNLDTITSLHKEFDSLSSIKKYNQWYEDVKASYPLLISEVEANHLSDQYASMMAKYEATYNSSIHTISYSVYNQMVNEYEENTKGMVASFFKVFVSEVETFD